RMHGIAVTFPINGEVTRYPLDRYTSALMFLMTKAGKPIQPEASQLPQDIPQENDQAQDLVIGKSILQAGVPVPVSVSLMASIPGFKFSGEAAPKENSKLRSIRLRIRRPGNLIVVSVMVMFMMMSLAVSVVAMALEVTTLSNKFELLPLSLSISLIFGLPALRNIQPGVPPVGALADYVAFIWSELFVCIS